MWRCSDELKERVVKLDSPGRKESKHYIGTTTKAMNQLHFIYTPSLLKCSVWRTVLFFFIIWQAFHWSKVALFWWNSEFWKHIPPNEPFRVLLGDMRDRMYYTRERMRQLLATGKSDINVEDTFTNALQVISQRHSNLSLHKNWKLIQYHMLDFNRQW